MDAPYSWFNPQGSRLLVVQTAPRQTENLPRNSFRNLCQGYSWPYFVKRHYIPLVIFKDQCSHLVYLNIMHNLISNFESIIGNQSCKYKNERKRLPHCCTILCVFPDACKQYCFRPEVFCSVFNISVRNYLFLKKPRYCRGSLFLTMLLNIV